MPDTTDAGTRHFAWARQLAAEQRFGERDQLGTANLVDDAARARAAAAIRTGRAVSLSRPLADSPSVRADGRPAYRLETFYTEGMMSGVDGLGTGTDHLELDCHGKGNTHVDGLNHIAFDGKWYGGWPVDGDECGSVDHLAAVALVTRAIHVDVPKLRGTSWVDPTEPVTGADFDAAFRAVGTDFVPGDALIVDMGRDRFEAAGAAAPEGYISGVGADGAHWIADHGVAVLCWDFLDATVPGGPTMPVHVLNWAIGLVLVDNCDFTELHADPSRPAVGALVLAPLPAPTGATGCNVNPLFVP